MYFLEVDNGSEDDDQNMENQEDVDHEHENRSATFHLVTYSTIDYMCYSYCNFMIFFFILIEHDDLGSKSVSLLVIQDLFVNGVLFFACNFVNSENHS